MKMNGSSRTDTGKESSFQIFLFDLERRWLAKMYLLAALLLFFLYLMSRIFHFQVAEDTEALQKIWHISSLLFVFLLLQFILLKKFSTNRIHHTLHALITAFELGLIISIITVYTGGFNSDYYAGLTLIIITLHFFMPWRIGLILISSAGILGEYMMANLLFSPDINASSLVQNLFILIGTILISSTVGHFKFQMIRTEFFHKFKINEMHRTLQKKNSILEQELKIARNIQQGIIPDTPHHCGDYSIHSRYQTAKLVGGDFFDIIETDRGETLFLLADASGHGIPASLITTMLKIGFADAAERHEKPIEILKELNNLLGRLSRPEDYVTAVLIILGQNGRIRITNAGHPYPIKLHRERGVVSEYTRGGNMLGIFENDEIILDVYEDRLDPGDRILLYTDGISENLFTDDPLFGSNHIKELMIQGIDRSPEELLEEIMNDPFDREDQGIEPQDDITLILIERKKGAGSSVSREEKSAG